MSADVILIVVSGGITIVALNLLLLSVSSYWRYRRWKLLFMCFIFLLFFIRGLYFSFLVLSGMVMDNTIVVHPWAFDFIILILLYITSLKR